MAAHEGTALDALIIFSDNLLVKSGRTSSCKLTNRQFFWEGCGESNIKCINKADGRVDPVLKIFRGCEVMLTKNDDVKMARANGTRAAVEGVDLKPGEQMFEVLMDGVKIPAVFASQVEGIRLLHKNKAARPKQFTMKPTKYNVKAFLPNSRHNMSAPNTDRSVVIMEMNQLPVTSNTATTCHKLQGTGVDNLFVSEWKNEANWIYVILSRVTSLKGLFLCHELKPNPTLHKLSEILMKKIQHFKTNASRPTPTTQEYQAMCQD